MTKGNASNTVFVVELIHIYKQTEKMPAHNGRFGASGGVARPTLCVEQPLPLSSAPLLYPRLRQAAGTLHARGERVRLGNKKTYDFLIILRNFAP